MNDINTPQLSELIKMNDPEKVFDEVRYILRLISKNIDVKLIEKVYKDMIILFSGKYPGYSKCNTVYHNITHTTDTVIAMARLIHGAIISGKQLSYDSITLGIIAPILHDTGYIQTIPEKENGHTGAIYTMTHIQRSNGFVENYFLANGFPAEWVNMVKTMIRCTGLNVSIKDIHFKTKEIEFLGKTLGTADLIGQMGDRVYVEKILYLYDEFQEAGIPGYSSAFDLLVKTLGFHKMVMQRFTEEYDSINELMEPHFHKRWSIKEDLYKTAISKNIEYIKMVSLGNPEGYRHRLRRDDYIIKV